MIRRALFVISFVLYTVSGYSSVDSLWKEYHKGVCQDVVSDMIFSYYNRINATNMRDSAMQFIINNEFDKNYTKLNAIYNSYFKSIKYTDTGFSVRQAKEWVKLSLANKNIEMICHAYNNEFKLLMYFNEIVPACESAEQGSYYSSLSTNKIYKILSLLNTGKCYEFQNRKKDAYRNYLDALYFSLEEKNDALVINSLHTISDFFALNKIFKKAEKYKELEIVQYTKSAKQIDSSVYYSLLSDLSDYLFDNNELNNANHYSNLVLAYCSRSSNRALLTSQLTIIRSNYFENNKFEELYNLYVNRFPSELDSLKNTNSIAYFRILSLLFERENNIQEAVYNLDSAECIVTSLNKDLFYKSNFYNRKGEFFMRQKIYDEAIQNFLMAYQYAESVHSIPFLITTSKNLDSVYTLTGDYKLAHEFRGKILNYKDSLNDIVSNDEIVLLEIENLEKQKELLQKQIESNTIRKHNLQYMFIVILIAFSFIVLLIAGSFKIHRFIIKALGFFVFIFLFEFIILLADNKIHHLTDGEPLKIIGLKILLLAVLFPLHHWVEEKVVHYLLHYRIIDNVKFRSFIRLHYQKIKSKMASSETPVAKNN